MENVKGANTTYIKTEDDVVVSLDLSDIPHGALIGSKDFEDGRHIDFYEALPGIKVKAFNEQTGKAEWAPVQGWSVHTGCALKIVTLANGDQIFTDEDPRAVFGIPTDSETLIPERFTPSEALARGVVVPCLKSGTFVSEEIFPFYDATDNTPVKTPISGHTCLELTFDCGQALGILVNKGWWSHNRDTPYKERWVHITDQGGYAAKALKDWVATLGEAKETVTPISADKYEKRYGDSVRHSIHSDALSTVINFFDSALGGESTEEASGAFTKHLPSWFSMTPEAFKRGLLCGLMSAEGTSKKTNPLPLSYTTVSFRLARDIRMLCWQLGVKASITKNVHKTTAGNDFWIVSISSMDAKEKNLFDGMCNLDKLEAFNALEVNTDDKYVKKSVFFPQCVAYIVGKWLHQPVYKDWMKEHYLKEYNRRKENASLYVIITRSGKTNSVPQRAAKRIIEGAIAAVKEVEDSRALIEGLKEKLRTNPSTPLEKEELLSLLKALDILFHYCKQSTRKHIFDAIQYVSPGSVFSNLLRELDNLYLDGVDLSKNLLSEPMFIAWRKIVEGDYNWSRVVEVEDTDEMSVSYDITVPGYETFSSDTGTVISNTMTYYVPVSRKAVQEAYDLMLPSKNQLAARDFKALPEMQEELVSGAWLASHKKNGPVKAVFNTPAEAVAAYRAGKIDVDDNIVIKNQQ